MFLCINTEYGPKYYLFALTLSNTLAWISCIPGRTVERHPNNQHREKNANITTRDRETDEAVFCNMSFLYGKGTFDGILIHLKCHFVTLQMVSLSDHIDRLSIGEHSTDSCVCTGRSYIEHCVPGLCVCVCRGWNKSKPKVNANCAHQKFFSHGLDDKSPNDWFDCVQKVFFLLLFFLLVLCSQSSLYLSCITFYPIKWYAIGKSAHSAQAYVEASSQWIWYIYYPYSLYNCAAETGSTPHTRANAKKELEKRRAVRTRTEVKPRR